MSDDVPFPKTQIQQIETIRDRGDDVHYEALRRLEQSLNETKEKLNQMVGSNAIVVGPKSDYTVTGLMSFDTVDNVLAVPPSADDIDPNDINRLELLALVRSHKTVVVGFRDPI